MECIILPVSLRAEFLLVPHLQSHIEQCVSGCQRIQSVRMRLESNQHFRHMIPGREGRVEMVSE